MLALLFAVAVAQNGSPRSLARVVSESVESGRTRHRGALQALYQSSGYDLIWIRDGRPTAQALTILVRLATAEEKGLRADDYDGAGLLWFAGKPMDFDVLLSSRTLEYVSDLTRGRVDPSTLKLGLRVRQDERELASVVDRLSRAPDVDAELAALEPHFPIYRRTVEALHKYVSIALQGDGDAFSIPPKPVAPGETYSGVQQLAERLRLLGDLPVGALVPVGNKYAGAIVNAVELFQSRHGLTPTGRLDAATVRMLNVPLRDRVAQLRLTLERLRWLPRGSPKPAIVVNIPEFRLRVLETDFHPAFSMKVVVGGAWHRQTPVFTGTLRSVIFNPYWEVPPDIAARELVPHIERDPAIMEKENYEIVNRRGTGVTATVPDLQTLAQVRGGALRIRQRPGAGNALGRVKFIFPNQYSVYLHGTPAQKLFARDRRDFSHGCIRLEEPERLASWVLRNDPAWTPDRIHAAMEGRRTIRVDLIEEIPVLILYGTAVVDEDRQVHFFEDIYGLDRKLEQALEARPALPRS